MFYHVFVQHALIVVYVWHEQVGYGNYRYFFLFLLYMFLGAGYAAGTAAVPFLHLQSHGSHGRMKLPATLPVERTRLRGYTPAAAAADADHTTRRMLLGEEVPLAGYDKRFFSSSAAQEILLKVPWGGEWGA